MAFLKLKNQIYIYTRGSRTFTSDNNTVTIADDTFFQFSEVIDIKTSEATDQLIDTAEIRLAKTLQFTYTSDTQGVVKISPTELLRTGDKIIITLGYEDQPPLQIVKRPNSGYEIYVTNGDYVPTPYQSLFTGYIVDVQVGSPVVIRCENEMTLYKSNNRFFPDDFFTDRVINNVPLAANPITVGILLGSHKTYLDKNTSLKQILSLYYDNVNIGGRASDSINGRNFPIEAVDVELPGYKTDGAYSLVQIFDDLKDYAGILAYFKNGTLYVGPEGNIADQNTETFIFQENIINSEDLIYQHSENLKYRIEIINIKLLKQEKIKNKKAVVKVSTTQQLDNNLGSDYFGDAEGEIKKLYLYNFDTNNPKAQEQLEDYANAELLKYKYTGYAGSFETFGAPVVYKADLVTLIDPAAPERGNPISRKQTYLVKGVDRLYDAANAKVRQTIKLSRLING